MIGVYGGTFNPIHYGHLRTALEVKALFNLDQLRLIPCRQPPHREQPAVSGQMRLEMLQIAINGIAGFIADSRELDRDGPSYMVDTLMTLRQEFPDQSITLFIGADAFLGLEKWHRWQQLFDYAHVVVMTRPNFRAESEAVFLRQRRVVQRQALENKLAGCLFFQAVTPLDISATQIRQIIATGGNPQFLLPDAVLAFIRQHQLYQAAPLTTGH
ncbi:MAG: nicotinate-nucleotide adenylyltransferase [Methylomonas sp.]